MVLKKVIFFCEEKKKSCRVDKEIRERNWKCFDGKLLMFFFWEIVSR